MKNTLLVEGNADKRVIEALCAAHQVATNLFIIGEPCGSDNQVLQKLNALIPASNRPACIGLVLDTDQNGVASRWQSIRSKLGEHPYQLPEMPDEYGTVIESSDYLYPRLGFWLMPNNRDLGMLENFVQEMIPSACVENIERILPQAGTECATYRPLHRTKALVHTYLAWQDEPGRPMGQAITAQVLRPETPTAYQFTEWLSRLFT